MTEFRVLSVDERKAAFCVIRSVSRRCDLINEEPFANEHILRPIRMRLACRARFFHRDRREGNASIARDANERVIYRGYEPRH